MQPLATTNSIAIKRSANALWCDFQCVQSETLDRAYRELQVRFIKQRQGETWARVVNLAHWQHTMHDKIEQIARSLHHDVDHGLCFEAVVLPPNELGKWMVRKILNQAGHSDVFHTYATTQDALENLTMRGWNTDFSPWKTLTFR